MDKFKPILNTVLLFVFILTFLSASFAQKKEYQVACVGFYNFENLFDTINDPKTRDGEFTPEGANLYTSAIYQEKLDHLSQVVSEIGTDLTPDGLALLGVAEIENRLVLEDFAAQEQLKNRNYQIVHYDSPDRRGIDVALLYQPKYFELSHSKNLPLLIENDKGDRIFTRDVLWVAGLLDGEPIHVFVNHWPSRRGGEQASAHLREAGAALCKAVSDSLLQEDPNAKIIIMGDLNDDPVSSSVKKVLKAKGDKSKVKSAGFYNPMLPFYKKGFGTLAYRDAWSLFDQLILSYGLINPETGGYQYYKTDIFNKPYLVQKTGQYRGYPMRTYSWGTYIGGYSDHFPVYLYLLKEK